MIGYGGRLLFVDLTRGTSEIRPLPEGTARAFLGGNGLAACLLWEAVAAGVDPYDPANAIALAVGPITDTLVPGNSRACIATKSPLTGIFFDSTFGGRFPATLKRTGFDAVLITGRAPRPVYLVVTETGATLRDARPLWGLTTKATVEAIQAAEGTDADALAIGPAGEHRVRFACLAHYWKNREGVSGRGGIGAVCGAKHLKAICVTGARKTAVADPARLKRLIDETREPMKTGTQNLSTYGTPFLTGPINALGALGALNLRQEVFPEAEVIDGRSLKAHYHDKDTTCLKCPVACGKQFAVPEGVSVYGGTRGKMPEYETLFAFGSMLGNANAPSIIQANIRCDLLGLDSISMGVTLAFVAECLELGLLRSADVGVPFGWGEHAGMIRLIEQTARREGFGDRLAEGSRRLAAEIGQGAERLPYVVKGLELPAHSARALKGMSIGYATATRGGSHHDTRPTPQYAPGFDRRSTEDKPAFAIRSQHFTAVDDSLVMCRFTSERGFGLFVNETYAGLVSAVTGWEMTAVELERVGERIVNVERRFNVREGVRRKDDVLPWKVMHEPIPDGPSAGMYCPPEELAAMLDAYYALRGWDADGVPTPERLGALGLADRPGLPSRSETRVREPERGG
ncbi:MAG: aldehyde ferredoxin oxidoreductase family protein [Candidatus Rokubacteria bacterium]|nr:aldehyde ferredoxin oxidoreductase family protein [Candidatus Rokubacteria bacterium]